jgi:hypothetical protein
MEDDTNDCKRCGRNFRGEKEYCSKKCEVIHEPFARNDFPEIIVLCGSTKFIKLFDEMMLKFTLEGKIVLSVGTHFQGDHGAVWADKKEMLDNLHFRKIDLADRIFVINKDGYIGFSTRNEIEYGMRIEKPIDYLEAIE